MLEVIKQRGKQQTCICITSEQVARLATITSKDQSCPTSSAARLFKTCSSTSALVLVCCQAVSKDLYWCAARLLQRLGNDNQRVAKLLHLF